MKFIKTAAWIFVCFVSVCALLGSCLLVGIGERMDAGFVRLACCAAGFMGAFVTPFAMGTSAGEAGRVWNGEELNGDLVFDLRNRRQGTRTISDWLGD